MESLYFTPLHLSCQWLSVISSKYFPRKLQVCLRAFRISTRNIRYSEIWRKGSGRIHYNFSSHLGYAVLVLWYSKYEI